MTTGGRYGCCANVSRDILEQPRLLFATSIVRGVVRRDCRTGGPVRSKEIGKMLEFIQSLSPTELILLGALAFSVLAAVVVVFTVMLSGQKRQGSTDDES